MTVNVVEIVNPSIICYLYNSTVVEMAAFNIKPSSGWIHPDKLIAKQGASYAVRYVGCVEVNVSMKVLDFKTRSSVAKECINKVCEAAGLKTADRKKKVDKKVMRAISGVPNMNNAGTNVSLNISSLKLRLTCLESQKIIANHEMPRISFASGGDSDTLDFVAYIAKDENDLRACYVLECGGGLAKDVISTIGQAFELRFQQFAKTPFGLVTADVPSSSNGAEADKDYYNDLPGKVPPDVEPPPVPPLPTTVQPFTTLPLVTSTHNLIDLNSDICFSHQHDYVNDTVMISNERRDRDVFDMQPFSHQYSNKEKAGGAASTSDPISELHNEIWFHGQISRAEAERLLEKDGDFLVRESTNSAGQYVLSGMQDKNKKHLLLIDPEGVVRTKYRIFNSVSHLIQFHFDNVLPIISAESTLVLRNKIPRHS